MSQAQRKACYASSLSSFKAWWYHISIHAELISSWVRRGLSLELSSKKPVLTSDTKPTIASRWIDRLGKRVGPQPAVGILTPEGRKQGPVTCIAASEKHGHHRAMGH